MMGLPVRRAKSAGPKEQGDSNENSGQREEFEKDAKLFHRNPSSTDENELNGSASALCRHKRHFAHSQIIVHFSETLKEQRGKF